MVVLACTHCCLRCFDVSACRPVTVWLSVISKVHCPARAVNRCCADSLARCIPGGPEQDWHNTDQGLRYA